MARDMAGSGGEKIVFSAHANHNGLSVLSISIMFQRTSGGGEFGYGRLMGKAVSASSTTDTWHIMNDNGNSGFGLTFEYRRSGNDGWWSIPYPSNGVWHNLVITYDGGSTSNDPVIYLNGVSQTVTERRAPTGTLDGSTGELYLGTNADNTEWDGPVCEYGIWNRVLSADEALGLGKKYSPSHYMRGLMSYIPVIGRASPEPDLVTGTTGTVTGTTNFAHPPMIYPE